MYQHLLQAGTNTHRARIHDAKKNNNNNTNAEEGTVVTKVMLLWSNKMLTVNVMHQTPAR